MADQLDRLKAAAERSARMSDLPPALRAYLAALEDEARDLRVLLREVVEHYHVAAGHTSYANLLRERSHLIVDCPDDLCHYVMRRTGGDYLTRSARAT